MNSSLALRRRHPRMDAVRHDDGTLTLRKIQPVNDLSAAIERVSVDPFLIEPMAQLMGDDPVLMEEKLNYEHRVDLGGANFGFLKERADFIEGFALYHDWGYFRQQGRRTRCRRRSRSTTAPAAGRSASCRGHTSWTCPCVILTRGPAPASSPMASSRRTTSCPSTPPPVR